jgi:putative endonuclease
MTVLRIFAREYVTAVLRLYRKNTVIYTGVTNDLKRRAFEHREGLCEGFTKRYRVRKLIYYEIAENSYAAISREKQIKGGSRADKLKLIGEFNPDWRDLYDEI